MKKLVRKIIPQVLLDQFRTYRFSKYFQSSDKAKKAIGHVNSHWKKRILDVISSPDNAFLKRVPDAGKLEKYHITMHNGVKICANGYYGSGMLNMLIENKGVHEPQEERVFEEVIKYLPKECTMLELGAYWGFYSLSLLKKHPQATCFLVEPDPANLKSGKLNFKLNQCKGHFLKAMVDRLPQRKPRTISVDEFCKTKKIKQLNILHADIQGFEFSMLLGARNMLSQNRIDYLFISTHTDILHIDCLKYIKSKGYNIIASANMNESFSHDGLIVAKRSNLKGLSKIQISLKKTPQYGTPNSNEAQFA